MADVGGTLTFDDIPALGDVPAGLPRFVPQLDANTVEAIDTESRLGRLCARPEALALAHHPRALPPLRELFLRSRGPRARSPEAPSWPCWSVTARTPW